MFVTLIEETEIASAQRVFEANLAKTMGAMGLKRVGFPGGNRDLPMFGKGNGELWGACTRLDGIKTPRYWNAFGIFDSSRTMQDIVVEINPPVFGATGPAGFFARDTETNRVHLFHDCRIGGGYPGVNKTNFQAWAKPKLLTAIHPNGRPREGVALGAVDSPDLFQSIGRYVNKVRAFKTYVRETPTAERDLNDLVEMRERFMPEPRGRRSFPLLGQVDYVSYHGLVLDALVGRIQSEKKPPLVLNSQLVDLFTTNGDSVLSVFELKTSLDRQSLYTAIGQLAVHAGPYPKAKRVLVVPSGELPEDIRTCINRSGIELLQFHLTTGEKVKVRFVERGRP